MKNYEKLFYHQNSETTSNQFIFQKNTETYSDSEIENIKNKLNYAFEKNNTQYLDEYFRR